ncbi:CAP domain-containing protein [Bacillus sp. B1-b2]|uniref:CAP domain-containing protein n=1 Tax=Bacillus sp. B1-b2 TaxID=2653201 RepID=UPI00299F8A6E|nr:CAP domain-containing protein [Bacillus sp. B1-b2]
MKILYSIVLSTLLLALSGCNNQDDAAVDPNMNLDTVSSMNTDTSSKNYPHTIPVKVQDTKYEFRTVTGTYNANTGKVVIQNNGANQSGQINQQTQNNTQPSTQPGQTYQPTQSTQPNTQPNQTNQSTQQTQPSTQATPTKQANSKQSMSAFVASVIELTNEERKKQGLGALQAYPELSNVADVKAKDMYEKGYFSHTSPTYGSPFDMMRDFGITYQSAGENIAKGQRSPEEVVKAWMNSEGHRANILSDKYTHIGVGFEEPGFEWVQMFVKK